MVKSIMRIVPQRVKQPRQVYNPDFVPKKILDLMCLVKLQLKLKARKLICIALLHNWKLVKLNFQKLKAI